MIWIYAETEPQPVEERKYLGMRQYTVNYEIEKLGEVEPGYRYRYKSVRLEPGLWGYDAIVNALVTAEYPSDRMTAIINNYMYNPEDASIKDEWIAMQEWRAAAKKLAMSILGDDGMKGGS